MGKPISVRAYARHRGCTHQAVRKAIDDGRLEGSVVRVRGQAKIADVELADREWTANTRAADPAPPPGEEDDKIPFNEARRRREVELWRQARIKSEADELELAERKGELVSTADARAQVVERYTVVKTRLLGLPARVKQRLPHVAADDVRVIDDLVREALEDLADGRGA